MLVTFRLILLKMNFLKFIDEYGTVDDDGDFEEIESFPSQDWYYVEWTNTEEN